MATLLGKEAALDPDRHDVQPDRAPGSHAARGRRAREQRESRGCGTRRCASARERGGPVHRHRGRWALHLRGSRRRGEAARSHRSAAHDARGDREHSQPGRGACSSPRRRSRGSARRPARETSRRTSTGRGSGTSPPRPGRSMTEPRSPFRSRFRRALQGAGRSGRIGAGGLARADRAVRPVPAETRRCDETGGGSSRLRDCTGSGTTSRGCGRITRTRRRIADRLARSDRFAFDPEHVQTNILIVDLAEVRRRPPRLRGRDPPNGASSSSPSAPALSASSRTSTSPRSSASGRGSCSWRSRRPEELAGSTPPWAWPARNYSCEACELPTGSVQSVSPSRPNMWTS